MNTSTTRHAIPRTAGHGMRFTKTGKFDHTVQPRCKCGWTGAAGNASQARALYVAHVHKVKSGTFVPGPFDRPLP